MRDTIERRVIEVAEHIARAHGCTAKVDYMRGYPVTVNHSDAVDVFEDIASREVGDERLVQVDRPFMGGEDFAFYGQVIPACFFLLGLLPPGKTEMPALHHPAFDFNDEVIETGVAMFRRLALGN